VAVADRLLSIQAQDPRGARLAIRARSRVTSAAEVDRELSERRTLLITWLNRGTLHMVRSQDYAWLHPLLTPPLRTSSATRLGQMGVDGAAADRGVAVIARALADEGPLTREQLRAHLQRAGLTAEGQALIHLVFRAAIDGICVRGPMLGRQHAYVLTRDWLGPQPAFDRDLALRELARRYLVGHGPATADDLARWAGLPLRDARAGLQAIAGELRQDQDGLLDLARRRRMAPHPPPRLLGAFEPLLLGWRSRANLVREAEAAVISGGIFRSFVLAEGRVQGLWRVKGGQVEIELLPGANPAHQDALAAESEAIRRFLGLG
jgi:hypothetical protein